MPLPSDKINRATKNNNTQQTTKHRIMKHPNEKQLIARGTINTIVRQPEEEEEKNTHERNNQACVHVRAPQ
jgi:hypothetical protein